MRSVRAMRTAGIWLGCVLTLGLAALLLLDRHARLDAATRQSLALATGVDRLLHYELRNVHRALRGIVSEQAAGDASGSAQASARPEAKIAGVLERHAELVRIERYGPDGTALSSGQESPQVGAWLATLGSGPDADVLLAGPLLALDRGEWGLPLALAAPDGGWLVGILRTREFDEMVDALDIGRQGHATIYTRDGVVVARFGHTGTHLGRRVDLPVEVLQGAPQLSRPLVSQLDSIERAMSFSNTSDYPLVVSAGIGLREALAPWRVYAGASVVLVVLYWLVFVMVLRRARNDERARHGLAAEVARQADWLQQAQLASGTGIWRLRLSDDRVRVSAEMATLFGLPRADGEIPLETFVERMHEDDRAPFQATLASSRGDGVPFALEYRVRLPGGGLRWLKARGAKLQDGDAPVMTGTVVDITEQRAAQARIEHAESQFRHLFERNPLPAWVYDLETLRFLAVNEAAVETYGYSHTDLESMAVTDLLAPEDQAAGREALLPGGGQGAQARPWMLMTRDARHIEVRVHARTMELDGRPARLVLAEDVSARMTYERDLAWRASHDAITGMLTLGALATRLDAHCAADGGPGFAIAYVQLRDLELVAPTLGRRAGDTILCEAAARFGRVADRYGWGGCMPAETFVIAALDPDRLEAMVAELIAATAAPVEAEGGTFPLEAWIGLARGPCGDGGAEKVIGHAALAALHARRENLRVVHYSASMAEHASRRLALVQQLRQAHERGDFELHYQPIVRLADDRVVAIEALLRWRRPDGSYVPPAQFIPVCEESGLIVPIGAWVLETAAQAHAQLSAVGRDDIAIAVNVSAVQFEADVDPGAVRDLFQRHRLPPRALHLELTESVLLRRPDEARTLMGALREEGLCLSIDDFGTGFSSMAYLRELPLDHLKIDRAFVRDVTHDARSAAICRAFIALGQGLGLSVIAEGVEDASQLAWLRAHGCDQAQGYYFARPVPLSDLLDALAAAAEVD